MKNKKEEMLFIILLILLIIIQLLLLVLVGLVSAPLNDIKTEVCNSINITEPNCTIWWDDLNLTDLNFTEITVEHITEEHNYDYSNDTVYEGNKTYVYYNSSLNQSYLDKRYVRDTELNSVLSSYAKKADVNATIVNNTIIQTTEISNFTWWNVFSLIEFVFILAIVYVLIRIVKEINHIWGEE